MTDLMHNYVKRPSWKRMQHMFKIHEELGATDVAQIEAQVLIFDEVEAAHYRSPFKAEWASRKYLGVVNVCRGSPRDSKYS